MKLNKFILPLVVALAAMLATTGCKHGTTKLTKLPGQQAGQVGDQDIGGTKRIGDAGDKPVGFDNPNPPADPFGRHELSKDLNPDNMNQDRAALAANTVHFDYDSAVVKDKEQVNVANVAQALSNDANAALLIEGNCDERGTEEYNRTLGEHRAEALREQLIKSGVSADRIAVRSYGKDKPVDTGHNEAAYAKNRRGDFVLLHPK